MSLKYLQGAVLAAALAAAGSASAGITNLGFETGTLAGWTTNGGTAGAATSYGSFGPYSGNYLGFVQAGLGAYVYTTLDQTFTLAAGETVSGVVGFQANDYLPYNDNAYLTITTPGGGGIGLFYDDVATVGDFGNSGWVPWSYTASTAGSYTLELGVDNDLDNELSSGAVLDATTSGVPEPAAWALMLVGFAGLGVAIRARRKASAPLTA